VFVLLTAAAYCAGGSWPTWRHDAARSGVTTEKLADKLKGAWTLELGPIRSAWPHVARMNHDRSYEPIIAQGRLYLANPNNDSMAAYDVKTGKILWKIFNDAPVRAAPVYEGGKLFYGCDDGYLYCVSARDGVMQWRYRAAPKGRPVRRHLGNGRFISMWPLRGGPVATKGRIYFTAGVWPNLGVVVHCVSAKTGKAIWINKGVSFINNVRMDHNRLTKVGLSPMGYLSLAAGRLIVPNGRSLPAGLEPKNGKLVWYQQSYRNGGWNLGTSRHLAFVGDTGVIDLRTGREIGTRWFEKRTPKSGTSLQFFEGPISKYKFVLGCSAESAFKGSKSYGVNMATLYCYDIAKATKSLYPSSTFNVKTQATKWTPKLLWSFNTDPKVKAPRRAQPDSVAILAGDKLIAATETKLVAFKLPKKTGKGFVVWQHDFKDTVTSIAAAEKTLFVATKKGNIHAFTGAKGKHRIHKAIPEQLSAPTGEAKKFAAEIMKAASERAGYAVMLGLEDGRLIDALLAASDFRIIALESDEPKVKLLRKKYDNAGLYGSRLHIVTDKPLQTWLPPFMATVITSEKYSAGQIAASLEIKAVFDALRPYGGVLCLRGSDETGFKSWADKCADPRAKISSGDFIQCLRSAGPLANAGTWTHEAGTAQRTFYSNDTIAPPLGLLWYGDGIDYGFVSSKAYDVAIKPQGVSGYIVALDRMKRWLVCIDIFTGRHVWKEKAFYSRYSTHEDGVYIVNKDTLIIYDLKTGRKLFEKKFFTPKTPKPQYRSGLTIVDGDTIIAACGLRSSVKTFSGRFAIEAIAAFDRKTHKQLWKMSPKYSCNVYSLCMAKGILYLTDAPTPLVNAQQKRRGKAQIKNSGQLRAIDTRTGKAIWEISFDAPDQKLSEPIHIRLSDYWNSYSLEHDLLLSGGRPAKRKVFITTARDGKTGKTVWSKDIGSPPHLIIMGDTFLTQNGATYDIKTGRKKSSIELKTIGCNYTTASANILMRRDDFASYIDRKTQKRYKVYGMRSGCSNVYLATDGVLAIPNFSMGCTCNYPLQTSVTMAHMPETAAWEPRKTINATIPSTNKGQAIARKILEKARR